MFFRRRGGKCFNKIERSHEKRKPARICRRQHKKKERSGKGALL